MKTLNELAEQYKTDKREVEHNYVEHYDNHFSELRESCDKFLEIGIYRPPNDSRAVGASLKMWKEYFTKSKIYGFDLDDFSDIENERIKTFTGNQDLRYGREDSNPKNHIGEDNGLDDFIKSHGSDFDIIIDDGGHYIHHQQSTLGFLFEHLKSGGVYVIEDLHTSYNQAYNIDDTTKTTLYVLQNYINNEEIDSHYILDSEKKYLDENIDSIIIERASNSEIAFIKKK